jgi:hypothetical protein
VNLDDYARVLERVFREQAAGEEAAAAVLPVRECRCGSVRWREQVVRHWGWHAVLLEELATCLQCGTRVRGGRLAVSEHETTDIDVVGGSEPAEHCAHGGAQRAGGVPEASQNRGTGTTATL